MKRLQLGRVGIFVLIAVFCLCATAGAAVDMKLQCIYPEGGIGGQSTKYFIDRVDKYTNGEVKIKIYWPGQLVETKEVLNALKRGVIQMATTSLLYASGAVPEAMGTFLPYSWKNSIEAIDVWLNHGYLNLMREVGEKRGFRYMVPMSTATYGIVSQFPINTLEDLKGKKLRAGGMMGAVAAKLGAIPVSLTSAEQFIALQRGTVDGLIYPWYTIRVYKYEDVISHICSPGILTPAFIDVLMNEDEWKKLSPAHQDAINKAALEAMLYSFVVGEVEEQIGAAFNREHGIKTIELSPEEVKRFRETVQPIYEEHAKKGDLCAKQVEIIQSYLKEKGR